MFFCVFRLYDSESYLSSEMSIGVLILTSDRTLFQITYEVIILQWYFSCRYERQILAKIVGMKIIGMDNSHTGKMTNMRDGRCKSQLVKEMRKFVPLIPVSRV